jgi:hypothetical protein
VARSGIYGDLTGKPTTLSTFTNDSGYQTSAQVIAAIQAVVGAAPAALDTLQEIATQLASDENAVAALTANVAVKADKSYVDAQIAATVSPATTSSFGVVKIDGVTITSSNGVISAVGGGGGGGGSSTRITRHVITGSISPRIGTKRWYPEGNVTITSVYFYMGSSPPVVGSIIIDIKKNGVSIFGNNYPTCTPTNYRSNSVALSTPMLSTDYLTIDIVSGSDGVDLITGISYN